MAPGRRSKALSPGEIRRLTDFRMFRRLTIPQLKLAMEAPFQWQTLKHALAGEPVWEFNHKFIVEWLDVHCPKPKAPIDGKAAASGEREEDAASDELVSRE